MSLSLALAFVGPFHLASPEVTQCLLSVMSTALAWAATSGTGVAGECTTCCSAILEVIAAVFDVRSS
eukprot:4938350-Heterocapsa_arctica.AAC.1